MNGGLLVGIDIGTSTVKVAVTDAEGNELTHASSRTRWTPVPTGAETTLSDLRHLVLVAVTRALAQAPSGPVLGVGVTGMAEAGSLLDRHGAPVAPIIAWHDRRGAKEAEQLVRDLGADRFTGTTGLPVSATPTIMKLAWLKRHREAVADARQWLGVPESLVHSLGGAPVADLSLACRTGLLELEHRAWWREAVDWLDVPDLALGDLVRSGTPLGTIESGEDLPPRLNGAVLTVAGHDHLTAAFGAGATGDGDVFDSCGTAEALLWATRPLRPGTLSQAVTDGLSVSWHVVPQMQAVIATTPTGLFLSTVLERLGCTTPHDRDALDSAAQQLPDANGPYVGRPDTDALLTTLERGWRPEQVWRAAIESATAELADLMTAAEQHGGSPRRLIATGGWTRSRLLLRTKLQRFGPTAIPQVKEAGARGAALMAGVASGLYRTAHDAPPPTYTELTPTATGSDPRPD